MPSSPTRKRALAATNCRESAYSGYTVAVNDAAPSPTSPHDIDTYVDGWVITAECADAARQAPTTQQRPVRNLS